MAYTINKTDGTIVATVNDGVLDTTTSVSLIGRNYQSYGEAFNENLVKLLENSSSATAPSAPLEGELWWDKTNDRLKVYTGNAWVNVGVESSSTEPSTGLSTELSKSFWSTGGTISLGANTTQVQRNLPSSSFDLGPTKYYQNEV